MTITKRLMLSAVTTFALGVGAAMAQSQVPSAAQGAYFSQTQQQAAPKTAKGFWGRIDAGASDIEHGPRGHTLPFNGDYSDLANPG